MVKAQPDIRPEEVDVVVVALQPDLGFLEEWRAILRGCHLIVVQGCEFAAPVRVPGGLDADIYTQHDVAKTLGPDLAKVLKFTGHRCKSFGYLVARRRYVITLDGDCVPARDPAGNVVSPIVGHLSNLKTPATPFFFNTLYDPYVEGTDFVRGYPFSLREGVPTAVSHGLWLNVPDYEPAVHVKNAPDAAKTRYVDAVLTVPTGVMFPMSAINLAFDRTLVGAAMFAPSQVGAVEDGGAMALRCNGIDDIWAGLCCKAICDHFGFGVKSGLPYICRKSSDLPQDLAARMQSNNEKNNQWMENILQFFNTTHFSSNALDVESCYLELAQQVKVKLSPVDPAFADLALSMRAWIQAWKKLDASVSA